MPTTDFVYVADEDGLKRYNKQGIKNNEYTQLNECTAVAVTESGEVFASFDTGSDTSIVKFDSNFNTQWQQTNISVQVTTITAVESVDTLYYGTRSSFGYGKIGRIRMGDGAKLGDLDIPSGGVTGISWDARGWTWLSTETDGSNTENIYAVTENGDSSNITSWTVSTSQPSDNNPTTGIRFDNEEKDIYFTDADGVVHKANADFNSSSYPGDKWTSQHAAGTFNFNATINQQRDYFAQDSDGITRLNQGGSTQWSADIGKKVQDISADSTGAVYVLSRGEYGSEQVHKLNSDGTQEFKFSVANSANDIAAYQEFDADPYSWRVEPTTPNYIHSEVGSTLVQINRAGNITRTWSNISQIRSGPVVDQNGVVYVEDADAGEMKALDNNFNLLWSKPVLGIFDAHHYGTDAKTNYSGAPKHALYVLEGEPAGSGYNYFVREFKYRDGYLVNSHDESVFDGSSNIYREPLYIVNGVNNLGEPEYIYVALDKTSDTYAKIHRFKLDAGLTYDTQVESTPDIYDLEASNDGSVNYLGGTGTQVVPIDTSRESTIDVASDQRDLDIDKEGNSYTDAKGISLRNDGTRTEVSGKNVEYYSSAGSLRWSVDVSVYGTPDERSVRAFPDIAGHPQFWNEVRTRSVLNDVSVTTEASSDIPTESTSKSAEIISDITVSATENQVDTTSKSVQPSTKILVSDTYIQADTESTLLAPSVATPAVGVTAEATTLSQALAPEVFINITDADGESVTYTVPNVLSTSVFATSLKEQISQSTILTPVVTVPNTVSEEGITDNSVPASVSSTITFTNTLTESFAESISLTPFVQVPDSRVTANAFPQQSPEAVDVTVQSDYTAKALTAAQSNAVAVQVSASAIPANVARSELTAVSALSTTPEIILDVSTRSVLPLASADVTTTTYETGYDTVSQSVEPQVDVTQTVAKRAGLIGVTVVELQSVPTRIYSRATTSGVNEQRVQTLGDYNTTDET